MIFIKIVTHFLYTVSQICCFVCYHFTCKFYLRASEHPQIRTPLLNNHRFLVFYICIRHFLEIAGHFVRVIWQNTLQVNCGVFGTGARHV